MQQQNVASQAQRMPHISFKTGFAIRYELKRSHVGVTEALSSLNFENCVHFKY